MRLSFLEPDKWKETEKQSGFFFSEYLNISRTQSQIYKRICQIVPTLIIHGSQGVIQDLLIIQVEPSLFHLKVTCLEKSLIWTSSLDYVPICSQLQFFPHVGFITAVILWLLVQLLIYSVALLFCSLHEGRELVSSFLCFIPVLITVPDIQ